MTAPWLSFGHADERAGSAGERAQRSAAPHPASLRLSRRQWLDGDRDLRLAPARALLRRLDHGLGEHHRPHPRLSLARLLARRQARRSPAEPFSARGDRARRGALRGDCPVRGAPAFGTRRKRNRSTGCRHGRRFLLRGAHSLCPSSRGARHGRAVRDQALRGTPGHVRRRGGNGLRSFHRGLLAATSALALGRRGLVPVACIAALLALPPGAIKSGADVLYESESAYQFIRVVQDGNERVLELNEGVVAHSVYDPASVLTGGYWDLFLVPPLLLDHPVGRVAILGNAGGTVARAYRHFYPQARIDGVEIDAKVTSIGERFFGLRPGRFLRL